MKKTLIIGFGNPGRIDDGLGPLCIENLKKLNLNRKYFTLDSDYQLTLEMALDISRHDKIIFIDANVEGETPFCFEKVAEVQHEGFGTHSISPGALMQLANCIYNKKPEAWILGIRGYSFNDFGEYLSEKAKVNLQKSVIFLKEHLIGCSNS